MPELSPQVETLVDMFKKILLHQRAADDDVRIRGSVVDMVVELTHQDGCRCMHRELLNRIYILMHDQDATIRRKALLVSKQWFQSLAR